MLLRIYFIMTNRYTSMLKPVTQMLQAVETDITVQKHIQNYIFRDQKVISRT